MSRLDKQIAQTEQRLAEIEALQLTVKEVQLELAAYHNLLAQKLELLRNGSVPKPESVVPEPEPIYQRRPALDAEPVLEPEPEPVPVAPPRAKTPVPRPAAKPPTPLTRGSSGLRAAPARPAAPPPEPEPPPEAEDEAEEAERRSAPRRSGNPISVQVSNANASTEPFQGWVVDRSAGGIRLLVDQAVKPGVILSVRPTKAHASLPWVQVQVRSCRPERNSFNLGCQFAQKLSWAELQMFG